VDGVITFLNDTIDANPVNWQTGMNLVLNDTFNNTKVMETHLIISAKEAVRLKRRNI
jgi:S-ribosylhomocysteine lyase LuxS involved in autoinducer biosynthesis